MIVCDLGCLYMRNIKSANFKRCAFTEAVYHFACFERCTNFFFNFREHVIEVGVGYCATASLTDLYNEHGVYICVVLLVSILIPSAAFLLPFLNGCFQKNDIVILGGIFGVGDNDAILQKSRSAHLVCGDYILLQTHICGVSNKRVEWQDFGGADDVVDTIDKDAADIVLKMLKVS